MGNPILSVAPIVELAEAFYGSVFSEAAYSNGTDILGSDVVCPADGVIVVQISTSTAGIPSITQIDKANAFDWSSELNGGGSVTADTLSEFEVFVREGDQVNFTFGANVTGQLAVRIFFRQRGG